MARPRDDDPPEDTRARIDILLLQTFHLVARTGSFSAAARELNLSYQTAANHVRRLEQMYGARLLEMEKGLRQVTLTPQGKALHQTPGEEPDTILSRIRILVRDARSVLRVGVPQALIHPRDWFAHPLTEDQVSLLHQRPFITVEPNQTTRALADAGHAGAAAHHHHGLRPHLGHAIGGAGAGVCHRAGMGGGPA